MSRTFGLAWIAAFALTFGLVGQAQAEKPTLVVVIPGWASGDGRRIEPPALFDVATRYENDLSTHGSQAHTIMYKWPSHDSNGSSVKDLAKQIRKQAAEMGGDVNLVVVGHSRGGVLANDVLEEVAQDKQFDYVQGVLLDPTAARTMGDRFPSKKPAGVDKLYNYSDGHDFDQTGWNVNMGQFGVHSTDSDHEIEGAENITVANPTANGKPIKDADGKEIETGHVNIVDIFANSNEGYDDTYFPTQQGELDHHYAGTVPESDRPKPTRETRQSPKKDDEGFISQIDKAIEDTGNELTRLSNGEGSLDPTSRLLEAKKLPNHWKEQGGQEAKHLGEMGTGAYNSTKDVLSDYAKDPYGARHAAGKWIKNEAEHLGGHYERMAEQYGKHWGGMAEHGAKHVVDSLGKNASDKIIKPAGEAWNEKKKLAERGADHVREMRTNTYNHAKDVVNDLRKDPKDAAERAGNWAKDQGQKAPEQWRKTAEKEVPILKKMPHLPGPDKVTKMPGAKQAADKVKSVGEQAKHMPIVKSGADKLNSVKETVTKKMPTVSTVKDSAKNAQSAVGQITNHMPKVPTGGDLVKVPGKMPTVPTNGSLSSASDAVANAANNAQTQVSDGWNQVQQGSGSLSNGWNSGTEQLSNIGNSATNNANNFFGTLAEGINNLQTGGFPKPNLPQFPVNKPNFPVGKPNLPNIPVGKPNLPNIPVGKPNLPNIPVGKPNLPNIPVGKPNLPNIPVGKPNLPNIPVSKPNLGFGHNSMSNIGGGGHQTVHQAGQVLNNAGGSLSSGGKHIVGGLTGGFGGGGSF